MPVITQKWRVPRWQYVKDEPDTIVVRVNRRDYPIKIKSGESDNVDVFTLGDDTYVLSTHRSLDYVGLTRYRCTSDGVDIECDETGDIFCQGQEHYEDILGRRGLDLSPLNIVKRLAEYLE